MKIREGDRFLYKFGWFGLSFGGFGAFLFGRKYECILEVKKGLTGTLWLMDNNIEFDLATNRNIIRLGLTKI